MTTDKETKAPEWFGWDWAFPHDNHGEQFELMLEALTDVLDNESDADAAMAYMMERDHQFYTHDRIYTPAEVAAMYTARKQEREYQSWEKIGDEYIDEHYPGLATDPMILLHSAEAEEVGRRVAAADSTQYWWYETTAGTIVCLLTPAYAEEEAQQ